MNCNFKDVNNEQFSSIFYYYSFNEICNDPYNEIGDKMLM